MAVNVKDFGAIGDGTTNDRTAIVNAIANAQANGNVDVIFPAGLYRIGSNLTINHNIRLEGRASLVVPTGVTVTFSMQPEISPTTVQAFYTEGTGLIAGLREARGEWFYGSKLNGTSSSTADVEFQKLADSVVTGGKIILPSGTIHITGSTAIQFTKGQHVEGSSHRGTRIVTTNDTTANAFRFTGSESYVGNLSIFKLNDYIRPTAGVGIDMDGNFWIAENLRTNSLYTAIKATKAGKLKAFDFNDSAYAGIWFSGHADSYANQGIISAASSFVTFSGVSGTFSPSGEKVTWSGNPEAVDLYIDPSSGSRGKIVLGLRNPTVGTVITGQTSGATATVASITHAHAGGGIRSTDYNESMLFTDIDVVGGAYSLYLEGTTSKQAANNKFQQCLFDSNRFNGVFINRAIATVFSGCWFSNRPTDYDVYLSNCSHTVFRDCIIANTYGGFLLNEGTAKNTVVDSCTIVDFNTGNRSEQYAMRFASGSTATVRNCTIGGTGGWGGFGTLGIWLFNNTNVLIENCDFSGLTGTRIKNDNTSQGTVIIKDNKGVRTKNKGVNNVASGTTSRVVNHGLSFTPREEDIQIFTQNPSPAHNLASINATSFTVTIPNTLSGDWWFRWGVETMDLRS